MTTRIDEAKATILDAAVAWARAQAGADADDVERWVRSYYAHVAPEDLGDRTVGTSTAPRSRTGASRSGAGRAS